VSFLVDFTDGAFLSFLWWSWDLYKATCSYFTRETTIMEL